MGRKELERVLLAKQAELSTMQYVQWSFKTASAKMYLKMSTLRKQGASSTMYAWKERKKLH